MKCLPIAKMKVCKITSPFGLRKHPVYGTNTMHNGIDYPCVSGTPVYAVDSGKVVVSKMQSNGKGMGNYIAILHPDNTYSLYAHLSVRQVSYGNIVKAGQQIALSGNTGDSTGPHLHFGICKNYVAGNVNNSAWMDPEPYLEALEDGVVANKPIIVDGEKVVVEMNTVSTKSGDVNYLKIRELEKLGFKVTYNSKEKCPEITSAK